MSDDLEQLKKYQANIQKMIADMPSLMNTLAAQEGETLASQIKNVTPVDTGTLRLNWHSHVDVKSNVYTVWVTNNMEYASFVEKGHRIVNKRGETIGWWQGKFPMRIGMRFYKDNLMEKHIQRFMSSKLKKYLGD